MENKQKSLVERLEREVTFGDLLEVTLVEGDFSARHSPGNIDINPTTSGRGEREFGILSVCGYYGGVRGYGVGGTEEQFLCLNPTIHREDAISKLHYQGDGLVKIPLSAVSSYEILSMKRRGLRVVN